MEESFEKYLSDEDSLFSGRGASRYNNSFGGDAYDFDVDLKTGGKDEKKRKKAEKKKEKEKKKKEAEEMKKRRASALSLTKEERMQQLLGQLSLDTKVEKERKAKEEMEMEMVRRKEEEERRNAVMEEQEMEEEDVGSLASDSLEMSSADFLVGGYMQKTREKVQAVALGAKGGNRRLGEERAGRMERNEGEYEEREEEEEEEGGSVKALKRRLSAKLENGEDLESFTFGDLSSFMKADQEESEEEEEEEEEDMREASEIYASIEADGKGFGDEYEYASGGGGRSPATNEKDKSYLSDFDDTMPSVAKKQGFEVGTRIRAKLYDWNDFYEGVVVSRRPTGNVDILFDDGDEAENIDPEEIEHVEDHNLGTTQQTVTTDGDYLEDDDFEKEDFREEEDIEKEDQAEQAVADLNDSTNLEQVEARDLEETANLNLEKSTESRDDDSKEESSTDIDEPSEEQQVTEPSPVLQSITSSLPVENEKEEKSLPPEPTRVDVNIDVNRNTIKPEPQNLSLSDSVDSRPRTPPENRPGFEEKTQPLPKEEQLKQIFWGGMGANAKTPLPLRPEITSTKVEVGQTPPPPPPPTSENRRTYTLEGSGKKSRLIQMASALFTSPPPPPPATEGKARPSSRRRKPASSEQGDDDLAIRGNAVNLSMRSKFTAPGTAMAEIARLQLVEAALQEDLRSERESVRTCEDRIRELEEQVKSQEAEIFHLSGKLQEIEQTNAVRGSIQQVLDRKDNERSIPREELVRIEREMGEQDRLLAGYQKENERLVNQLRDAEKRANQVRDSMYKANMRLGMDLNHQHAESQKAQSSAEDLRKRLDAEQAVQVLEKELRELKAQHDAKVRNLQEEIERMQERPNGERSGEDDANLSDLVSQLRKELAEARLEHLTEAKGLKGKLAWYVENQQLLNESEQTISELRERIRELEGGIGSSSPGKVEGDRQSRSGDSKRVRLLEKQVKDLEEALRKRNPNSIANLIRAAGPSDSDLQARREMRRRIEELENELESRDTTFNNRLRTLRQEHERVKLRYERLLENEASRCETDGLETNGGGAFQEKESRVVALEQELVRVRDFYRKKIEDLSKKSSAALRTAKREGVQPLSTTVGSAQRDADKLRGAKIALEARVEELELQLEHVGNGGFAKMSKQLALVSEENKILKERLEHAKAQAERAVLSIKAQNMDTEDEMTNDVFVDEEKAGNVENENRGEDPPPPPPPSSPGSPRKKKTLKTNVEHSQHLDELAQELNVKSDRIRILETEAQRVSQHWEAALHRSEQVVTKLHQTNRELEAQLIEAKKQLDIPMTPSMLQHQALGRRLTEMEDKMKARERELELIVSQVEHRAALEMQRAQANFDSVLAAKNQEILKFRLELDSMVETIRLLNS